MELSKRKKIYWLAFVLLLFIVYLFFKDDVDNRVKSSRGYNTSTAQPRQYDDLHSADSNNDEATGLLDKLIEDEEREHQDSNYKNNSYSKDSSSSTSDTKKESSKSNKSDSSESDEEQDNNDNDKF